MLSPGEAGIVATTTTGALEKEEAGRWESGFVGGMDYTETPPPGYLECIEQLDPSRGACRLTHSDVQNAMTVLRWV